MKIIADAWKDEALWLHKRRGYFTASEIFKLMTHDQLCTMGWWRESWMDGGLDEMVEQKLTGAQPDFKDPVAVEWGKEEEEHNRQLFERYSGIATSECHYFIGCDRWKYLATTLDGFSFVGSEWAGLARANMFDKADHVSRAILRLPRDKRCLLEMKQTSDYGVKAWADGCPREPRDRSRQSKVILGSFTKQPPTMPVYYLSQVHTQMAIAGFDWNLAVVKGGASHMHAHSYELDPKWVDILDEINTRVAPAAEKLRKELKA